MKFDLSFDPNGRTRVDHDVSIIISQMHNAAVVHTHNSLKVSTIIIERGREKERETCPFLT